MLDSRSRSQDLNLLAVGAQIVEAELGGRFTDGHDTASQRDLFNRELDAPVHIIEHLSSSCPCQVSWTHPQARNASPFEATEPYCATYQLAVRYNHTGRQLALLAPLTDERRHALGNVELVRVRVGLLGLAELLDLVGAPVVEGLYVS